jgi:PAS domain S-box-containing protein
LKHDGAAKVSPLEPASILLVDDDPANMLALQALLEDLGQNLVEARSGEEALRRLNDEDFAVVLLDVQMPGLDGFETARRIRLGEWSRHTPIIFLTAYDDDRFPVEKAYSLGAVDYLVKPLVPVILKAKVRSFVEIYQEKARAEENARLLVREESARRAAEEHAQIMHDERERLRVTLASIGDAVISTDAEGRIEFLNPIAEQLTGWTTKEASGRTLTDVFKIINETTREPVENPAQIALEEGRIVGLTNHTVLIARDGAERPIDDSAAPIRDSTGTIVGAVLTFRDITDQLQANTALRESEARKAAILESALDCIITMNHEGKVVEFNPAAEKTFGYTRADVIGRDLCEMIISPEPRDKYHAGLGRYLAIGDSVVLNRRLEMLAVHADGHEFPVDLAIIRIPVPGPPMFTAHLRDISERMKVETRRNVRLAVTQILAQAITIQEAAVKILETICKGLGWDIGALWLKDIEADALRCIDICHAPEKEDSEFVKMCRRYLFKRGEGLPGRVWASGKRAWIQDVVRDTNFPRAAAAAAAGVHGAFGCPLRVGTQLLGAIEFFSHEIREPDADLLEMMDTVSGQIGQFIERMQAYAELREADRRKDEFLATLAHELRNPLAPLRNALQILKMPRVDATTAQEVREVMERQVDQLVRLVDDLLDVSRVMRGKVELRKELVELASIIDRGVETAMPLIEMQGHVLSVSVPPESLMLDADPVRLAQVIGNLLTNAAKYTESKGLIWLTAKRDGCNVVLHVRDTGIGIAADMLPNVFALFVQGDKAAARSQGGLGIGLTLVKNLVEMHGGTVKARSAGVGKGSEFIVRLPLSQVEPQADSAADRDGQQQFDSMSPGHRLLVVDDNEDAANSLAILLRLKGHKVEVAHHGPAALEIAQNYRPDMIFLDIGMPGMDGYEVARRLRQHPVLKDVVLAALTGWGQEEDRRRSAEAGFDHHLVKPPEPRVVEGLLGDLGRRKA